MASGDPNYYARRASQERAMAEAAKDDCARSAHQTLANRYEAKAGNPGAVREAAKRTETVLRQPDGRR